MLSTTIVAMASGVGASGSACLQGGPQSMAFCTVRVVTLSEGVQTARQRWNVIGTAHDRCASTARLSRRIRAQSLDGWDRTGSHGRCLLDGSYDTSVTSDAASGIAEAMSEAIEYKIGAA